MPVSHLEFQQHVKPVSPHVWSFRWIFPTQINWNVVTAGCCRTNTIYDQYVQNTTGPSWKRTATVNTVRFFTLSMWIKPTMLTSCLNFCCRFFLSSLRNFPFCSLRDTSLRSSYCCAPSLLLFCRFPQVQLNDCRSLRDVHFQNISRIIEVLWVGISFHRSLSDGLICNCWEVLKHFFLKLQ